MIVQVHLAGVGDFQLKQIDMVEDPCPLRQHKRQHVGGDGMQVEDAGQKVNFYEVELHFCLHVFEEYSTIVSFYWTLRLLCSQNISAGVTSNHLESF